MEAVEVKGEEGEQVTSKCHLRKHSISYIVYEYIIIQAGTTCGSSSQADLTQNLVLKTRMLRFSRHSRQKCRKQSFLRQKRAVFSIPATKKSMFLDFMGATIAQVIGA